MDLLRRTIDGLRARVFGVTDDNDRAISAYARYEATSNILDVEEAISFARAAVDATPEGHFDRMGRLDALGSTPSARHLHAHI
jgi:hypothetical protein